MVSPLGSNERLVCKEESTTRKERTQLPTTLHLLSLYPLSDLQAFFFISLNPPAAPLNCRPYMDKSRFGFLLLVSVLITLGLVSVVSCFVAEVKKAKRKNLKWDGRFCYLPGSQAYGLGFAALVCFSIAQIIGSLVICRNICCSRDKINKFNGKIPAVPTALLLFSWSSFGMGVILMSTATSMSKTQSYGKGWVDGECYLVKDGVFTGSGFLVLISIGTMLGAAVNFMARKLQVEQEAKVHAQVV